MSRRCRQRVSAIRAFHCLANAVRACEHLREEKARSHSSRTAGYTIKSRDARARGRCASEPPPKSDAAERHVAAHNEPDQVRCDLWKSSVRRYPRCSEPSATPTLEDASVFNRNLDILQLQRQQKRGVPSRFVRRRQLWRRESAEGRAKKRKRVRSMHGAPFINRRMKNTTKFALGPTGARQSRCILCVYHTLTFSITECAPLCVEPLPQCNSHFGSSDTRCHSHSYTRSASVTRSV